MIREEAALLRKMAAVIDEHGEALLVERSIMKSGSFARIEPYHAHNGLKGSNGHESIILKI